MLKAALKSFKQSDLGKYRVQKKGYSFDTIPFFNFSTTLNEVGYKTYANIRFLRHIIFKYLYFKYNFIDN